MLLTSVMRMPTSNATSYDQFVEVQPFIHQPGIYYENLGHAALTANEWKWYVYYDMAEYWHTLKTIQKGIHKLNNLANVMENHTYWKAIVTHYQQTATELTKTNELIMSNNGFHFNKRTKRGLINIVGNVASKLFGVLDEEYAAQVAETIRKVQGNENHLLELIKNQTSILEGTEAIMRKTEKEQGAQFKAIENAFHEDFDKLRNLTIEMKEQKASSLFISLSIYVSLLIAEYQQSQGILVDTITDGHHGRMNNQIMTADKLRSQIASIIEHIPPSLTIPTRNMAQLYQLMSVKCGVTEDYTIFVVQLPLVLNTKFELFKLIPLPNLVNGVYVSITPSTELIMVNLQRDTFYSISTVELSKCMVIEQGTYLCHQNHPIYNRNADVIRCETEMINAQRIADTCNIMISAPAKIGFSL